MKLMSCDLPTLTRGGDRLTPTQLATLDIKSLIVCVPRVTMSDVQWGQIMALIEAAPELLFVLEDAYALLVNGPNGCDDDPKRITSAVRDAIAKADGGVL